MGRILIILKKWPKGFICPCTGVKYHNIQTCLFMQQISGERLQDHWSSGLQSPCGMCNSEVMDRLCNMA